MTRVLTQNDKDIYKSFHKNWDDLRDEDLARLKTCEEFNCSASDIIEAQIKIIKMNKMSMEYTGSTVNI